LDESDAKIGYRALSHKDADPHEQRYVTAQVFSVTDRWWSISQPARFSWRACPSIPAWRRSHCDHA